MPTSNHSKQIPIGHVRYISVLTWTWTFQDKRGGVFFFILAFFGNSETKETFKKFIFDPKASEPCQNIDISNVAKHRVMFVHVTFFVVKYFFFNSSPSSYHGLFYGHAMFIGNRQKEGRYLSFPVFIVVQFIASKV